MKYLSQTSVAALVSSRTALGTGEMVRPPRGSDTWRRPVTMLLTLAHRLASAGEYLHRGEISDSGQYFRGCLVWRDDWGFWSEPAEKTGELIYATLTNTDAASDNAVEFEASEFVRASAVIATLLVFQWDGWIVFHDPAIAIRLSHDAGVAGLYAANPNAVTALHKLLWSDISNPGTAPDLT